MRNKMEKTMPSSRKPRWSEQIMRSAMFCAALAPVMAVAQPAHLPHQPPRPRHRATRAVESTDIHLSAQIEGRADDGQPRRSGRWFSTSASCSPTTQPVPAQPDSHHANKPLDPKDPPTINWASSCSSCMARTHATTQFLGRAQTGWCTTTSATSSTWSKRTYSRTFPWLTEGGST